MHDTCNSHVWAVGVVGGVVGGGGGAGVPMYTTAWIYGSSTTAFHSVLVQRPGHLPVASKGGGEGVSVKLLAPPSESGAPLQKLSHFMLQIPLKISRLVCE